MRVRLSATIAAAGVSVLTGCGGHATHTSASRLPVEIVHAAKYTGFHVPSSSMEPTLHCAKPAIGCLAAYPDRVVVQPLPVGLQRGDIVAFRTPPAASARCGAGGVFIKRLIGLPGETWQEKAGYVYIDGKKLDEPYVASARRDFMNARPLGIKSDSFFVMGDNRASSCDSRVWGTVPRSNIIGKVVKVFRQR